MTADKKPITLAPEPAVCRCEEQQAQQEQRTCADVAHRGSLRATARAAIRPARTSPSLTAESSRGWRLRRSHTAGPRR